MINSKFICSQLPTVKSKNVEKKIEDVFCISLAYIRIINLLKTFSKHTAVMPERMYCCKVNKSVLPFEYVRKQL